MSVDLKSLREKAEAATQGEWYLGENEHGQRTLYSKKRGPAALVVLYNDGRANAAYLTAANPQAVIALLDEIERLRERAYPLEAELHCERHGYYDGRKGCAQCLTHENSMHRQILDEKLGAWQVSKELGDARWEIRRQTEHLATVSAALNEACDIAEQHWARRQIDVQRRDEAVKVVSQLRKAGRHGE